MASLTPEHRSEEVVGQVMNEGLVNGGMVFIPALGGLYAAMRNPTFRKVRNLSLLFISSLKSKIDFLIF